MTHSDHVKHFDVSGLQRTTISILGALTVLTTLKSTSSFEEEINLFNKRYFDMINGFMIDDNLNADLYAYYSFHDVEDLDLENILESYSLIYFLKF